MEGEKDLLQPESPEKLISEAKNFEELFAALDKLGGLQGSQKFYPAEKLKDRIQRAREGVRILIEYITRTGGLRNKVLELLDKETPESQEI